MKGGNIFHNLITLLVAGLFLWGLYASYAAAVVTDPVRNNNQTEGTAFTFSREYEEDIKLKLIWDTVKADNDGKPGNSGTSSPLDAYLEYKGGTLSINGTEAFNMEDFLRGSISLGIDYRMVEDPTFKGSEKVGTGVCDLGNIPFFLAGEEPYWRIANRNGAWGTGIADIGVPDEIYQLIPRNITGLLGYNDITSYQDGELKGTVTIGKFTSCTSASPVIPLSSLGLSGKINQEILANGEKSGTLEIVANYYFSIPLSLSQETSEDILNPAAAVSYDLLTDHPQIQGKITLRTHVKVVHDMDPAEKTETAWNIIQNYN